MMRRRQRPSPAPAIVISADADRVTACVPVSHADGIRCTLEIEYEARDPLAVRIVLRAPSGNVVVERTMLRRDLQRSMHRRVAQQDLVVEPSDGGRGVQLVFREGSVALGVLVPFHTIEQLMEAARRIVAFSDQAEAEAVGRALAVLTQGRP